jgi:hypothetical protein
MAIVWKRNGKTVDGPEAIPNAETTGAVCVRGDYKKPIISDAMGFVADPGDVAEHRKRFPDIELHMSEGCARPMFRNLGQKRRYLKAMGWIDRRSFV